MDEDVRFVACVLKTVFPERFVDQFVAKQKGFPRYIDQALLRKQLSEWISSKEEEYESV